MRLVLWLALMSAGMPAVWAGQASQGPGQVWVFLRDKPDGRGGRIDWSGIPATSAELDLGLDPEYLVQIRQAGIEIRACSRWLNAVSVRATAQQQDWLRTRPFAVSLQPVASMRRLPLPPPTAPALAKQRAQDDYGPSFAQLAPIGVVALHSQGYQGQGVCVAVLDDGFQYEGHPAFVRLRVRAAHDFVNGDEVVGDQTDQPVTGDERYSSQNVHGGQVLSLLAARDPGYLIGVAPEAEYLLAKTEEDDQELPVEEDRWIQGLEWADSLGADVVNSSLGYNTWDDGTGYTYEQLDGATALSTRAAQLAVARGMVVVAAAGNEGNTPWRYLTTPADAPGVIAVGAASAVDGRWEALAPFSSRGPTADGRVKPDVVAPGAGVLVADVRGTGYLRLGGTSFAAPLVSGICALLLQIHPEWTPVQVQAALRQGARDLGDAGPDTAFGWGLVDGLAASRLQVGLPSSSWAGAPYPNPSGAGVVFFPLHLASEGTVGLRVFDVAGGLVAAQDTFLVAEPYSRPKPALRWDVPPQLADGLYYYQVRGPNLSRAGKVALVGRTR